MVSKNLKEEIKERTSILVEKARKKNLIKTYEEFCKSIEEESKMLNCEKCVKNDVCGKKDEVCELLKKISLNGLYQSLITKNIKIDIKCDNYLENKETLSRKSMFNVLDEISID